MRAEELIAGVWKQNLECLHEGVTPGKVVMSKSNYELLQRYHAGLGLVRDGAEDYITRYSLFGLTIYIDNSIEYKVEV